MITHYIKQKSIRATEADIQRIDLSKISPAISQERGILYVDDGLAEHTLDVYFLPNELKKPILIDIHGGGFISGDKEVNRLFGNTMAQKGFVVFNLNYRLAYPEYTVFDQVIDIDRAVGWILRNAANYNGDVSRIVIAGHSSAGVLAVTECLLCKSGEMREHFGIGERAYEYRGLLLDCGLMHFYQKSIAYWGMRNMVFPKHYKKMPQYRDMIFEDNPALSALPKTFLITNDNDELKDMTFYFKSLLDKNNVPNTLDRTGSDGHMGIVFRPYTPEGLDTMEKMIEFFN